MKKLMLLSICFAVLINLACDCAWNGNFITVAPGTPMVIKAKVLGFYKKTPPPADPEYNIDQKMEVEILKIFKGKETKKKIIIWGDNGAMCRPYVSAFRKDAVYYLAINPLNDGDYYISVCGEYYLKVRNGKVRMQGNNANETVRDMTEVEFEKLMRLKLK